ncbi:unnamed protein product [Rangifer tarandus platyrhynchus]|uniref:Uncharacterized protein n=1 Tax=Rangifer tarandus platyrhynchus TaxID=3082113 RepID=A0AC59Z177_RANTA
MGHAAGRAGLGTQIPEQEKRSAFWVTGLLIGPLLLASLVPSPEPQLLDVRDFTSIIANLPGTQRSSLNTCYVCK